MMHSARVAYVWSQEMQDVAGDLPANIGRSSLVHGLVNALDLLHEPDSAQQHVSSEQINRTRSVQVDPNDFS